MPPAESGQSSSPESDTEEGDKEESEALSSKGEKRSASEDVEEIAPPQTFKHLRREHAVSAGQTLAAVEMVGSISSKDSQCPREHPVAKR